MTFYRDDEGARLPIKLDTTSNGEFSPVALSKAAVFANSEAHKTADENAKRLGLSRRKFLISSAGAAATLATMNDAFGQAGIKGGFFDVPAEAGLDAELASHHVEGDEFIFDVQGHHVNPNGAWRRPNSPWDTALGSFPQSMCGAGDDVLDRVFDHVDCFSAQHYVKEIFLDSDTDLAVLSFVPSNPADAPLDIEDAAETREIVDALEGNQRLLLHGRVLPNFPGEVENMENLAENWGISAWKTYTQFGPDGKGFWLDDPVIGIPMIERARAIGIKVICIHKGLPLFNMDHEHSTCRDIGVVAKMFPDMTFIVYHSGLETNIPERAYDPGGQMGGINSLVQTMIDNEIPPNSNIYAELGSSWRFLMRDPEQAAHGLGKLFKYIGEDRVLWGTDSIWYGSPQDQIQAFRTFQITDAFQERYGYPAMTPELRAKVFGLNATVPYKISAEEVQMRARNDAVEKMRETYAEGPEPSHLTYGPRTRREFMEFLNLHKT